MATPRKRKIREEKRPACNACRSQKLKCDAFLDYTRPCSRCSRRQAECIVLEERRKRVPSNFHGSHDSHDSQNRSESSQSHVILAPQSPRLNFTSGILPLYSNPLQLPSASSMPPSEGPGLAFPTSSIGGTTLDTKSRVLEHVHVDATMIDICFARFFRCFAPLVPKLSTETNPEETFLESPLKFWVIVAIGSRQCAEDPTLFAALSPHVEALAMKSFIPGRELPYANVEALLLMGTWHVSTDTPSYKGIYCALSSAVLTLTMQAGLHSCLSLKGVINQPTSDIARGTQLWAYAVILNQSSLLFQGLPADPSAARHVISGQTCCSGVVGWMVLRARLSSIVIRMQQVVTDLHPGTEPRSYSKTIKSLIQVSEAELLGLNIDLDQLDPLKRLNVAITRLKIRAFSFPATGGSFGELDRVQLSNAAIALMDAISQLEITHQISLHCPDYVLSGIMLAGCTLLKLMKGYSLKPLCESDQVKALFLAISICKDISVVNNDVPAKMSEIMRQLWSSPNAFHDDDGNYNSYLKVTNRLSMNVVFDCLWWSRKLTISPLESARIQSGEHNTNSSILDPAHPGLSTTGFLEPFFGDIWDWDLVVQPSNPSNLCFEPNGDYFVP
ncbi:hypothetical protein K491DRAFT_782665 [Lophiostoma macrostomum CBS 122681]|uniref:Zn(2)-C6 fungal-type domain-containing protein n=1 Tax=Lophiostoma macrostomum CBS 122681 TaxID=1314788 RepID=A0A6A6SRR9_9PLEO|nr:hypothetical protein K491DRAFT_782665 [Lophiostoma macrostomum CBS 122681]